MIIGELRDKEVVLKDRLLSEANLEVVWEKMMEMELEAIRKDMSLAGGEAAEDR